LEEEESDSDYFGSRKRKRKQQSSDSEFEVGGRGVESASEEPSESEGMSSEDEYRPPKQKARGGRQKVGVCVFGKSVCIVEIIKYKEGVTINEG
jgi:hypothetical protein